MRWTGNWRCGGRIRLTYSRYADDLTFSGSVFLKEEVLARVKEIIREEKFEPNHQKTRFLNENDRKIITAYPSAPV